MLAPSSHSATHTSPSSASKHTRSMQPIRPQPHFEDLHVKATPPTGAQWGTP